MNTIKINYNYDSDETTIKFNDEFNSLPMIQQLDAMKDGLCLLEKRCNTLLLNVDNLWDTQQRLYDRAKKIYAQDEWGNTNGV